MADVTAPDGRTLEVVEAGAAHGPVLVAHHGTPMAAGVHRAERESAERLGVRLIAYSRPGYGGSTPQRGRTVADAAADTTAVLDALGVERFATYGVSGGGPHALACAALLPERCAAVATVAGIGPFDAPDLDFLAGMGQGNVDEFAATRAGRDALTAHCERDAAAMMSVGPEELRAAMAPHLSAVDREALTGDLAEFLHTATADALAPGVEGWVDDDLAFLAPWGFELGTITVPALVWQGEQDLMVPAEHGRWLSRHVAGAEAGIFPQEGHLTLIFNRVPEVHAWLREHLT